MVLFQMFRELTIDGFFQDFGGEGVKGDGALVMELAVMSRWCRELGVDFCMFPVFGEGASG